MVQVKICGITNFKDARSALEYGADALGFVFYKKSNRYIPADKAYSIIKKLPPFTVTAGVFVNASIEEINFTVKKSGIKLVQLSGDESPSFVQSLFYPVIKTIHIGDRYNNQKNEIEKYGNIDFLLDSSVSYGGSGVKADWEICKKIADKHAVILAGGLTVHNVEEAIEYVKPAAVDVSSGVEKNPGNKDPEKMKEFIRKVKK